MMAETTATERPVSGLAITSLVLGILTLLMFWIPFLHLAPGLLAVVFGTIGLRKTRKGTASGAGLAVAGIVCAMLGVIPTLLVVLSIVGIRVFGPQIVEQQVESWEQSGQLEEFEKQLTSNPRSQSGRANFDKQGGDPKKTILETSLQHGGEEPQAEGVEGPQTDIHSPNEAQEIARTWTDNTGAHTVEAELVIVDGQEITLKRVDGKVVKLPIRRLSAADQKYLQSQQELRSNKNDESPAPKSNEPKASGKIDGQDFVVEQTKFQSNGGILTLRQGKEVFPDLGVIIFLFLEKGESPEGKNFSISNKEEFSAPVPHIHMKFKEAGRRMPKTQMFMGNYSMELRFGKAANGIAPGWINLQLPDESGSKIIGTFEIDLSGKSHNAE